MTFTSDELRDLVALARHHREHFIRMGYIQPGEDYVQWSGCAVTVRPDGVVEISDICDE
jgi:hypothetical protein